jgi:flagellar hook-associated protein 1
MGLIDTSLQIGRSSIMAHQLAMDVVGNNLANAATEGYARQAVDLRSSLGIKTAEGPYLGLGVNAESIQRLSDAYLEQRLRNARSDSEAFKAQSDMFQQLEGTFNELSDSDLSTQLNDFFSALSSLQGNPEQLSVRRSVVESAGMLTDSIRTLRSKIDELRTGINSEITDAVGSVNAITSEISQLNVEISRIEAGGTQGGANALRDRRDLLLGQLSDLVATRVVETGDGMVNVFAGADPLVMGSRSYDLATETSSDNNVAVSNVVFAADGRPLAAKGGKIQGLVDARDKDIVEFVNQLDTWTSAFIDGFNKIHSSGQGLDLYTSVTGTNGVTDPAAALSAAGLAFNPVTGTFEINVENTTSGDKKTFRIHIDLSGAGTDTTLASLVADINAAIGAQYPQIHAAVGAGNTLAITSSAPEVQFSFGNDTSGALSALGVNTFFVGHDSSDIALNPIIEADPGLIAAGKTNMPGDNSNVADLLAFQRQSSDALGGASVDTFYQGIVATLGIRSAAAQDRYTGSQAIKSAVQGQREAISGVSIDEETVNLIRYQSGYQAAARFISTVNDLIQVLLKM